MKSRRLIRSPCRLDHPIRDQAALPDRERVRINRRNSILRSQPNYLLAANDVETVGYDNQTAGEIRSTLLNYFIV